MSATTTACPGRSVELARLSHAYENVQGHQLILVRGEAGSGKGRLLKSLGLQTRTFGGPVLEGRCGGGLVLGAFASIVDGAIAYLRSMGVTPDFEERWVNRGKRPLPRMQSEPMALHKFMDDFVGLLEQVGAFRTPLVILHHLHKADADTLRLLRWFFEGTDPLFSHRGSCSFLLVASEETSAEPSSSLGSILEAARAIDLAPLGLDGLREITQTEAFLREVISRTNGNLQRVERLIRGPELTDQALHESWSEEKEPARRAQEALAVLGDAASQELVEKCTLGSRDFSLDRFESLTSVDYGGAKRFMFRSDEHRRFIYTSLAEDTRKALHRRCADVLSTTADRRGASYHAYRAGDEATCIALAMDEATALARRGAHATATNVLEECVTLVGFDGAPEPLVDRLIELLRRCREFDAALVYAEQAWRRSPTNFTARRAAAVLVETGQPERAEELLEHHEPSSADSDGGTVESLLARSCLARGEISEAARWVKAFRARAESTENKKQLIAVRNLEGLVAMHSGNYSKAQELFEHNETSSVEAGLSDRQAQALTNRGVAMYEQRQIEAAIRLFRRARSVSQPGTRDHAIATENLAVVFHAVNRFDEAMQHYEEAMTQMRREADEDELANLAANFAELHIDVADLSRARSLLEFADQLEPNATLCQRVHEVWGQLAEAEGAAEKAIEHYELALGDSGHRFASVVGLVRANLALGHVERARELLASHGSTDNVQRQARLALVSGEFERAAGGDQRTALARALRLARESGDMVVELEAIVQTLERALQESDVDHRTHQLAREALELDELLLQQVPIAMHARWKQRPIARRLGKIHDVLSTARPWRPSDAPSALRTEEQAKRYASIVGESAPTQRLLNLLDKVAPSEADVLVVGETGTGKELIADAIHRGSPRAEEPLIKVNCAALVETLLLSELFGHEKGAFTGATQRKKGRFELAAGGVLFLDEIGDVSPGVQAALLRVLQERTFQRVGGTDTIHVNVRIVAATNRDLETMVAEKSFREDLYYRIRGVLIETTPLRKRRDDIPLLCAAIANKLAEGRPPVTFAPDALHLLRAHSWPGNVRELESVISTAALFATGSKIDARALAESFQHFQAMVEAPSPTAEDESPRPRAEVDLYRRIRSGAATLFDIKRQLEEEWIRAAYQESDGNITQAAKLLGMKRARLSQLIKQYGVKESQ